MTISMQRPANSQTVPSRSADDRSPPLVALDHVGLTIGGRTILDDVTLAVGPGEILTIIGPNGGGKTSLLKLVLGIVKPSRGEIRKSRNLRIGYVPQRLHLDPTMPMPVRRLMNLTARHDEDALREALAETGVAHLIDAEAMTLSGGEFQRVLIARALLSRPDLLVLDEPVQGVDFTGEIALYEKIAAIRERFGCAILLVSHDLHVVMRATDRVICLNGHVCCAGVPGEVASAPEYARLFGPKAAGTVALYHHEHDHTHDLDAGGAADAEHGHHHE